MSYAQYIFISYPWFDSEAHIEGQKRWLTEFNLALGKLQVQIIGEKPVIWRDVIKALKQ